ncbi:hypothetical protein GE21DRAFT_1312815 [Neurospora crassa]|nr:hypothetical protein GE21DRAFT_1312815 [Neurospora crassa]
MSHFLLYSAMLFSNLSQMPSKITPIIILPPIIIIVVIIMPQLLGCQKDSQCLPPFILSLLFQTSMLPPASHLLLKLVRIRGKRKG